MCVPIGMAVVILPHLYFRFIAFDDALIFPEICLKFPFLSFFELLQGLQACF
jgi:hypothetical protein